MYIKSDKIVNEVLERYEESKMEQGKGLNKKVQIMDYTDDFYKIMDSSERTLILYGMGKRAEVLYPYFENISYVCDKRADETENFHGIAVIRPEHLESLKEKLAILICVKKEVYRKQIKDMLSRMDMDAIVFDCYDNVAFPVFRPQKREELNNVVLNKVHLVCTSEGWILRKFAVKMQEELLKKGIKADISNSIDTTADINHHIAYYDFGCEPLKDYHDTLMVTHVDSVNVLNLLKHQLQTAKMGICMSRDTMEQLVSMGVPREKLCYINPAQDGVIKPRKYVLGITHRIHDDHRKRADALLDICDGISPDYFEFEIMGDGWETIVEQVRKKGFTVTYYPEFNYEIYVKLMPSLDYYLFWGFDEGSMGYLDALAAGIETIVTPQGYHLDTRNGLTYPCRTIPDFIDVLSELEMKKRKITEAVSDWTWGNYTAKHIEVWRYILGAGDVYQNKHKYEDGIFSVLCVDA